MDTGENRKIVSYPSPSFLLGFPRITRSLKSDPDPGKSAFRRKYHIPVNLCSGTGIFKTLF